MLVVKKITRLAICYLGGAKAQREQRENMCGSCASTFAYPKLPFSIEDV